MRFFGTAPIFQDAGGGGWSPTPQCLLAPSRHAGALPEPVAAAPGRASSLVGPAALRAQVEARGSRRGKRTWGPYRCIMSLRLTACGSLALVQ